MQTEKPAHEPLQAVIGKPKQQEHRAGEIGSEEHLSDEDAAASGAVA